MLERFESAVELAERAFAPARQRLTAHLAESLTGLPDGQPMVFRDSAVGMWEVLACLGNPDPVGMKVYCPMGKETFDNEKTEEAPPRRDRDEAA